MHEPFAMPMHCCPEVEFARFLQESIICRLLPFIPARCQKVLMEDLRPCNERMSERRILAGWLGPYNTSPLT